MNLRSASPLAILTALLSASAAAQTDNGSTVETVVVTAQSRQTELATTPVPINVISGADISKQNIVELKDLTATVPGVTFNESPGGLTGVSVRGLGSSSGDQLLEQSVGLFDDGVYEPRSREYRDSLFDVDRIEVVKGSQGVLFGQNTSIGAVSIVSKKPGDTLDGYVSAGYETEYGSDRFEGAVDLPVSDTFAVRLSGFYDQQNGWVDNVYTGHEDPESHRWLGRAVTEWNPTANLNVEFKAQYSHMSTTGNAFENVNTTPAQATELELLGVPGGGQVPYTNAQGAAGPFGGVFDKQNATNLAAIATYSFGSGYSLVATTGYTQYTYGDGFDVDATPAPVVWSQFAEDFHFFSQEIRLLSPTGGPVEYIVGLSFLSDTDIFGLSNNYYQVPVTAAPAPYLTVDISNGFKQNDESYSAFGQLTWHIAPKLKLDVGTRVGYESKNGLYDKTTPSFFGDTSPNNLAPVVVPAGISQAYINNLLVDAAATLSYDMTDESVLYANVGRGEKAGGFNNTAAPTGLTPAPFKLDPEQALTFEVGIKGRFLDDRAYASLSAYHINVQDYQDSYYDPTIPGFNVLSDNATSAGVEAQGQYRFASWLGLHGNFAYNPVAKIDATGVRLQRAPRFTGVIGFDTNAPISEDVAFSGSLDLVHSDSYWNQPENSPGDNQSGSYNLLNARVAFTYLPQNIELSLLAENITDARYLDFSFTGLFGSLVGQYNEPRTLLLQVRKEF